MTSRFLRLSCFGASLILACGAGSDGSDSLDSIHPQPQPNNGDISFIAPCSAESCGPAPDTLANPRCKPEASQCGWSDDTAVSYRPCPDAECGAAPSADVCPSDTTFGGNACGSENETTCLWRTTCVPPKSTTPCSNEDGCGPKPEIGVMCKDGSAGDLVCMEKGASCDWQRTCD